MSELTPDEIRRIRGRLPQRRMSELMEVSVGSVPDWESGRRKPGAAQEELLKALGADSPAPALNLLEARFRRLRDLVLELFQKNSSESA